MKKFILFLLLILFIPVIYALEAKTTKSDIKIDKSYCKMQTDDVIKFDFKQDQKTFNYIQGTKTYGPYSYKLTSVSNDPGFYHFNATSENGPGIDGVWNQKSSKLIINTPKDNPFYGYYSPSACD